MTRKFVRNLEQNVYGFFTACERLMLRTLIFSCFVYEVSRFARWLWLMR
jgi:hypothetical protein